MRSRRAALPVLVASLLACGRQGETREPSPPRPSILATVPRVGRGLLTDTTGSADAERVTVVVNLSADSVAGFYRARLPALGWRVVSDQRDTAAVSIYAAQGAASLWIQIRRLGSLASEYTLIAAVEAPDTAGAPAR